MVGDCSPLVELMQNLMVNAIKFHNRETSHIDVRARRRDHEWICPTRDNGIGIDLEFHERIFDIFQRPHSQQA